MKLPNVRLTRTADLPGPLVFSGATYIFFSEAAMDRGPSRSACIFGCHLYIF